MKSLADIRSEYTRSSLDSSDVSPDPLQQFDRWLKEAVTAKVPEPTAMNLATVTEKGAPSSRIVLLKGVENSQLIFFTNYQSQKGKELDQNPACALTFFWPELERQVRIEGIAERLDVKASEEYFQSRPRSSQIGAWASPQSLVIKDRQILEDRVKEIEQRFEGKELLPKPNQWGGFAVTPHEIEFWQGRPSRLHDRIVYLLIDGAWKISRLAP
jgi:pyridoxamine 5'-phosphate oxidase